MEWVMQTGNVPVAIPGKPGEQRYVTFELIEERLY